MSTCYLELTIYDDDNGQHPSDTITIQKIEGEAAYFMDVVGDEKKMARRLQMLADALKYRTESQGS